MSYFNDTASASTSNTSSCYKLMEDDSNSFCTTIATNDTMTDDKNAVKNYGAIQQQEEQDYHSSSCSSFGASLNLVNAMMGTGIIGLPLALHLCGFWVGLSFSILIAYLTCFTMHITILCGLKTNTNSMVSLCNALIGYIGAHIVNFIIFFHTAGTAVSYYLCTYYCIKRKKIFSLYSNIPCYSTRRYIAWPSSTGVTRRHCTR
jgi:hypothetical protein